MVASKLASDWMVSMCSARNWSNEQSCQSETSNAAVFASCLALIMQTSEHLQTPDLPLWSSSSSPTPPHVHYELGLHPYFLVQGKDALTSCFEWTSRHKKQASSCKKNECSNNTVIANLDFFFKTFAPACSLWTWCKQPSVWRRFWEAPGWSTCSPSGSCPGSWCGGRERHQCLTPAEEPASV